MIHLISLILLYLVLLSGTVLYEYVAVCIGSSTAIGICTHACTSRYLIAIAARSNHLDLYLCIYAYMRTLFVYMWNLQSYALYL